MSDAYFLQCQIGTEWYGVAVDDVIEVLHLVTVNKLPEAAPEIIGMMRFREHVFPVMDLRIRFGMEATYTLTTPIIVTRTPNGMFGLVVDDVDDIERVHTDQITPYTRDDSTFVKQIARVEGGVLLLLNIPSTVYPTVAG